MRGVEGFKAVRVGRKIVAFRYGNQCPWRDIIDVEKTYGHMSIRAIKELMKSKYKL